MSRSLSEYYVNTLKEAKGQPPPVFDDTSRGVLLALIKDRPTIWNSSAKLTKDDVLASFQQSSAVLSNMDPRFSLWPIIEKWCWIVESYVRCSLMSPPAEWRYNNALDFLKPFATMHYPYLGCISKKRRNELTVLYGDPEITNVMESTDDTEFLSGIFRDEMHFLSGEEHTIQCEADPLNRTVGQVVNVKRRGRPSKADKRSPVDHFINLTPQSAQFQKLLENNGFTVAYTDTDSSADELGFTPAMYNALIEMIIEKPELWQANHAQKDDAEAHSLIFEELAGKLILKFKDTMDILFLEKLTGPYVQLVWAKMKEKFKEEENLESLSKWRFFQPLQFLSNRFMPAFFLNNSSLFIKSEDPSTSGLSARVAVASPAGSSQSEDSRMASSSPSTASFVGIPSAAVNGNKSIQAVLDNLIAARIKKEDNTPEFSELKQMLEKSNVKVENENGGPSVKRPKTEAASPPGSSRMIVYNDTRKTTQAPISTWVPPREDLTSKAKEDTVVTPPQKRAQATAVIKSGFPLEKQLKKFIQQNPPVMLPVAATSSLTKRNGLLGLNSMVLPPSAIQQALLKKIEPSTTIASMPSVSAPQIHQAHAVMNGAINGNAEVEDKWTLLGRMIAILAREVETRDPVCACDMTRDLQNVMYEYNIKSLQKKESNGIG